MFPLTMTGYDRTYLPPRAIRADIGGPVTAWDLFRLEHQEISQQWAASTLASLIASVESEGADLLGCTECADTGFYGVADPDNPDLLTGLVRRDGEAGHQALATNGSWDDWDPKGVPLEVMSLDMAADLASAITAGACGLLRRYAMPRAFLPPAPVVAAAPLRDVLMSLVSADPPESAELSDDDWIAYATVDSVDQGAVFDVVRVRVASGVEQLERWDDSAWVPDLDLITQAELPMVRLTEDQLSDTQAQLNTNTILASLPKQQKCKYCENQASQRILHSEGMAYIPVCGEHLAKGKSDAEHCTPDGTADPTNIVRVDKIAAAGLVADAPLIVSPDPRAERLRRYWSTGRGGAKIRWTAPGSGDWYRCVRHLSKYMGTRAKGYCSNLHKRNTGVWPGSRINRGSLHASVLFPASPEESLLASVRTGQWGRKKERTTDMPLAETQLTDGIYFEGEDPNAGILSTITAGGFPVAPPDKWFENPALPGPTPMVVDDDGRVYGHIATWGESHIGMAGSVKAPHSPSNYAYFRTGAVKTEGGNLVSVGHLTLSGGHADTRLDHRAAVKHYDDTNSAVADVAAGEDQYGIWAAGALRPDVTPEQVRAFRASPPSGDWRVIGGNLELVAACCVNVPGFVNVRAEARVASGAILALVAAGARPLAELKAAQVGDSAVLSRLRALEIRLESVDSLDDIVAAAVKKAKDDDPEDAADVGEDQADGGADEAAEDAADAAEDATDNGADEAGEDDAKVKRITDARRAVRRAKLRASVHPTVAAGKVPPQFLAQQQKMKAKAKADDEPEDAADAAEDKADGGADEAAEDATDTRKKKTPIKAAAASTIKGTDSFPISDVASLKKAIQAFGRAGDKAAAKKHISTMAFKLKRPDLIPASWKSSK